MTTSPRQLTQRLRPDRCGLGSGSTGPLSDYPRLESASVGPAPPPGASSPMSEPPLYLVDGY